MKTDYEADYDDIYLLFRRDEKKGKEELARWFDTPKRVEKMKSNIFLKDHSVHALYLSKEELKIVWFEVGLLAMGVLDLRWNVLGMRTGCDVNYYRNLYETNNKVADFLDEAVNDGTILDGTRMFDKIDRLAAKNIIKK